VQVSVIPPSLVNNEYEGLALLSQFNPHGLFIVLEELAYLLMSISFAFMATGFSGTRLQQSIRYTFIVSFVLTVLAFVYYTGTYGLRREYRFEIAAITINWTALILLSILLYFFFRTEKK
jgi:hypothetical protein